MQIVENTDYRGPGKTVPVLFGLHEIRSARQVLQYFPDFDETWLHCLPGLAGKLAVDSIYYKDESERFGLGAFKGLGAFHAISRLLAEYFSVRDPSGPGIFHFLEHFRDRDTASLSLVCATDGSHGKAVAAVARYFGCSCQIYVHSHMTDARKQALAALSADVIVVDGNYDDAVQAAAEASGASDCFLIADTSWPGYEQIPLNIMLGYAVMALEVSSQMEILSDASTDVPTHVFLQAGVGSFAAALVMAFSLLWPDHVPQFVVVEPVRAACLQASIQAGERLVLHGDLESNMPLLSCGEPALLAWQVLRDRCRYYLSVDDKWARRAMVSLTRGLDGDPRLVTGESGAAGLAGLLAVCASKNRQWAKKIGLDEHSRILLIGTETASDADSFEAAVGQSVETVRQLAAQEQTVIETG